LRFYSPFLPLLCSRLSLYPFTSLFFIS
jgi:hypothetical protein